MLPASGCHAGAALAQTRDSAAKTISFSHTAPIMSLTVWILQHAGHCANAARSGVHDQRGHQFEDSPGACRSVSIDLFFKNKRTKGGQTIDVFVALRLCVAWCCRLSWVAGW